MLGRIGLRRISRWIPLWLILTLALDAEARIVKSFRLQIGNFSSQASADEQSRQAVQRLTLPVFVEPLHGYYKVTVGDFPTYQEAAAEKDSLSRSGFPEAFVVEVISSIADEPTGQVQYKVQIGNFADMANARATQESARNKGVEGVTIDRVEGFFKVRVGPYTRYEDAVRAMNALQAGGFTGAWITQVTDLETTVERRVISMRPATPASLTPPAAELRPDTLSMDVSYQVVVGPYSNRNMAENARRNLASDGFTPLNLITQPGGVSIEVGHPQNLLQANNTRNTLAKKGILNVSLVEVKTPAVVPPTAPPPTARVEPTQPPAPRPLRPPEESPSRMAEAYVQAAERLMEQGHFEAARDQYQLALEKDPQNRTATEGLGASLNAIRDEEMKRQDAAAEMLLSAARKMMEEGEYSAARLQFRLILDQYPGNAQALEGLAQAEERLQTTPQPPPGVTPAMEQSPEEAYAVLQNLLRQSSEDIAQGRLARARNTLQQGLQRFPDNPRIQEQLDQVERRIEEMQAAPPPQPVQPRVEVTEPERGFPWLASLGLLVILAGAGAGVYFLIIRKRVTAPAKPSPTLQSKVQILGVKTGASEKKEPPKPKPAPAPKPQSPIKPFPAPPPIEPEIEDLRLDEVPDQEGMEPEPVSVNDEPLPSQPIPASEPFDWKTPEDEDEEALIEEQEEALLPEEPAPEPVEVKKVATPAASKPRLETVFEQTFNKYKPGEEVDTWKGQYDTASLAVSQNRLIAGANHYLKFVKEPCEEETLFCALIPEAGRRPVFEFDLCCLGVNQHPMGVYLESVDNEEVSLATCFLSNPESDEIQISAAGASLPYSSGEWHHFRYEIDLDQNCYQLWMDGKPVSEPESLPAPVTHFDLISLKAQPETEGTLLFNNLKVSRKL